LADSDWLHGSAESLLTVTNLVTVVAFRQALNSKERGDIDAPVSSLSYAPMVYLVAGLTVLAGITAIYPALASPEVHTPYLGGFMDLNKDFVTWGRPEPENALTVATWIIHWTSLIEFLVAMGFAWRWADISGNQKWKGITWGLLPLHSSGITACAYHILYNGVPLMLPLQALLTCVGNITAAYAAYRLAISNGWKSPYPNIPFLPTVETDPEEDNVTEEFSSLIGFEDLGDVLAKDNDYTFLLKLFGGCAILSYAVKYGELLVDFPFEPSLGLGVTFVALPSALNAFKWYKRSQDPSFEGWF